MRNCDFIDACYVMTYKDRLVNDGLFHSFFCVYTGPSGKVCEKYAGFGEKPSRGCTATTF